MQRAAEPAPGTTASPAGSAAPPAAAPERVLTLQREAGNRAVGRLLSQRRERARTLARLDQHLPYVGALQSYLNPLNQATRLGVGRALSDSEKALLDRVYGAALSTAIIRIRENATIIAAKGCYRRGVTGTPNSRRTGSRTTSACRPGGGAAGSGARRRADRAALALARRDRIGWPWHGGAASQPGTGGFR